MGRFLAGVAACLLFVTGAILLYQSKASEPGMPGPPMPRLASVAPPIRLAPIGEAPEADAKSKEEKRFGRADKNRDGRITLAELVEPRRKAYAKLDLDHDGKLSFEEWAIRTIDKFKNADGNHDAALLPAEYAATAPKPKPKKAACACGPVMAAADD